MRVYCINDAGWVIKISTFFGCIWVKAGGPKYGDIDEVTATNEHSGRKFYELQAWPKGEYDANYFIPLSEIDETEFERKSIETIKTLQLWPEDPALK